MWWICRVTAKVFTRESVHARMTRITRAGGGRWPRYQVKSLACPICVFINLWAKRWNYMWNQHISLLLQQLDLDQLAIRKLMHQCTMFYKIHHNLVNISFPPCVRLHLTVGRAQHLLHYQRTHPASHNLCKLLAVTAPSVQAFQAVVALPAVRDKRLTTTH